MIIKVIGAGCATCRATATLIEEVARSRGIDVTVEKVEGWREFIRYGLTAIPAVVIDEQVVHAGGRPSRDAVERWLRT